MCMKTHLTSESNMKTQYVTRLVNLEPQDYLNVRRHADQQGLGGKGFSAALRLGDGTSPIIREWEILRRAFAHKPTPSFPEAVLPSLSVLFLDSNPLDPFDPCPNCTDPLDIPNPTFPADQSAPDHALTPSPPTPLPQGARGEGNLP